MRTGTPLLSSGGVTATTRILCTRLRLAVPGPPPCESQSRPDQRSPHLPQCSKMSWGPRQRVCRHTLHPRAPSLPSAPAGFPRLPLLTTRRSSSCESTVLRKGNTRRLRGLMRIPSHSTAPLSAIMAFMAAAVPHVAARIPINRCAVVDMKPEPQAVFMGPLLHEMITAQGAAMQRAPEIPATTTPEPQRAVPRPAGALPRQCPRSRRADRPAARLRVRTRVVVLRRLWHGTNPTTTPAGPPGAAVRATKACAHLLPASQVRFHALLSELPLPVQSDPLSPPGFAQSHAAKRSAVARVASTQNAPKRGAMRAPAGRASSSQAPEANPEPRMILKSLFRHAMNALTRVRELTRANNLRRQRPRHPPRTPAGPPRARRRLHSAHVGPTPK